MIVCSCLAITDAHIEQALVELERCAGSQFDPELAQAFVDGWRQGEIRVPGRPVRLAI